MKRAGWWQTLWPRSAKAIETLGVVTTSYPRAADDPAGCFVGEHVDWLRARGCQVEVIAAGERAETAAGITRVAGRGLFYDGGAPEALEAGGWRSAARVSAAMLAQVAIRGRRWDAVIAHWLAPSAIACALATRLPMVAVAHSGDVHILCRTGLAAATVALLAARGATLVFVSAGLRASFADAAPRRLHAWVMSMPVCSMGVDLPRFTSAALTDDQRDGAVFLGRLVAVKGVDVLLDAARRTEVSVAIAGDGPERAGLQRRAGDNRRVSWLGEVRGDARDRLLGRARLVVVPSVPRPDGRSEGTPRVALEAMAAGAPLIASATGGLAELPSGTVTLVPPGDAPALAAAISKLAAKSPERAAQIRAASQFVRTRDWSVVGPKLAPWLSASH